ncbi:hypothetical protein MOOTH_27710 [Moorella thermoacetica]|nr:hypothetical protein MOOTH_27710 [Moorella thermoacetica]
MVQEKDTGDQVCRSDKLFFAVTVDIKQQVMKVQEMPAEILVTVQHFFEGERRRPGSGPVVEHRRDDGRQAEMLALPLVLRGVGVDFPPDLDHIEQQPEGYQVVYR